MRTKIIHGSIKSVPWLCMYMTTLRDLFMYVQLVNLANYWLSFTFLTFTNVHSPLQNCLKRWIQTWQWSVILLWHSCGDFTHCELTMPGLLTTPVLLWAPYINTFCIVVGPPASVYPYTHSPHAPHSPHSPAHSTCFNIFCCYLYFLHSF